MYRFDQKLNKTKWQFYVFMEETERTFTRTYSAINSHHLAIKMLTRYLSFHITHMHKYIDFYRQYAATLDAFLTALDTLAEGVLSTPIIDPITLQTYIAMIEEELIQDTNYKPLFKDIYKFYAHKLVTFTNFQGMLLLQLPVLIKLKVQVPMSLYSINTVPVPMDAETYEGKNNKYSLIEVEYKYMAVTHITYVPLTEQQLQSI